jgi:2-polyprenyl-6-methoxyphenol hydroxylase-like FAD-dependent oxidoreductase
MAMTGYDVIVVGSRCAGSPTAMLLARAGYRVLLVDRATFPSDTPSTHFIHPPGVAALRRWGLLDAVTATGCPPVDRYVVDFGPFTVSGSPPSADGAATGYGPRRHLLDTILLRAADSAGAEIREQVSIQELLVEDGVVVGIRGQGPHGRDVVERARVVVGADGRNSRVARLVRAEEYLTRRRLQYGFYSYWADLPVEGFLAFARPGCSWGALPTNDGLTCVVVGRPEAEVADYRADIEGSFRRCLELAPEFADRVRRGRRVERFTGGGVRSFLRKPYGPGWALVGDAGCTKDPITAQGISDAFRDAELCAAAIDAALSERTTYDEALACYQTTRDTHVLPMYEFTSQMAALEPPPPELAQLLAAVAANPQASNAFAGVLAGTISPVEFFAPEHVAGILAGVGRLVESERR